MYSDSTLYAIEYQVLIFDVFIILKMRSYEQFLQHIHMILSLYEADQFVRIQMIRGHCLYLKEKCVCFCFRITIKAGFHFISCKHFNIFTHLSSRSDI